MVYIHGLGHFHPSNVIDNKFLEDLDIGTSDEWILERVGIKTRRTVLPLSYIKETRNQDPRVAREVMEYTNAATGKDFVPINQKDFFQSRNDLHRCVMSIARVA